MEVFKDELIGPFILLQTLNCGFDNIRDIYNIFEECITKDYDFVLPILHLFVKKKYVNKITRGRYEITEEGIQYLNYCKYHVKDIYTDIIKNTKKEIDIMVEHFVKLKEEYDKHPIQIKYFRDGKLIDKVTNELKYYTYFYGREDDKLRIDVFGCNEIFAPPSILCNDDILLTVCKDQLHFEDL